MTNTRSLSDLTAFSLIGLPLGFAYAWLISSILQLPACAELSGTLAKSRPVTALTAPRPQSAKTPARSYQVPEWWRREWTRRQYAKRIDDRVRAQEMRESTKAMWNPRSPQTIAYRRVYYLAHKDSLAHLTNKTNAKFESRSNSSKPTQ